MGLYPVKAFLFYFLQVILALAVVYICDLRIMNVPSVGIMSKCSWNASNSARSFVIPMYRPFNGLFSFIILTLRDIFRKNSTCYYSLQQRQFRVYYTVKYSVINEVCGVQCTQLNILGFEPISSATWIHWITFKCKYNLSAKTPPWFILSFHGQTSAMASSWVLRRGIIGGFNLLQWHSDKKGNTEALESRFE